MEHLNPQAIFIVITVFILFINKVVEMVREKSAERAAREDRRERRAERTQAPQRNILQPPPRQQRPTRETPREAPTQQQEKPASPFQDVLTELFEAAGVPVKPPEEKPPPIERRPPPIPGGVTQARVKEPTLSKEERQALERLERRGEKSIANRKRRKREESSRLTKLLLSKDAAKQAIVVAEILGPPRGMRDMEQR